jgi:hypothetical protein
MTNAAACCLSAASSAAAPNNANKQQIKNCVSNFYNYPLEYLGFVR